MLLKAKKALRYAGQSVPKHGEFNASDKDARLFLAAKIAEVATERKPVKVRAEDKPPAVVWPEFKPESVVEKPAEPERPKRTYIRRDMKASD